MRFPPGTHAAGPDILWRLAHVPRARNPPAPTPRRPVHCDVVLLAPASAAIAALLAIGAVVALYLLRLRRRPLWVSSILLWSPAATDLEVNVPLRMLRPSWLLLLHLLLAALVSLAIGRPAIHAKDRGAPRTILIIDQTASMAARDSTPSSPQNVGPTRLDAARREARTLLRAASRTDRASVAIIALAAEPRIIAGLSSDTASADRQLENLRPTDQPIVLDGAGRTSLDAALDLAEAMLAEGAESESSAARIVIISDGDLPPVRSRGVPGARIDFIRVGPAPDPPARDNLGIVALAARRLDGPDQRTRLFARVHNASSRERSIFAVISAGDSEIARRPLTIPPRADAPLSVDLAESTADTLYSVRLDAADALPADDQASILLPAARPVRILVVTPGPNPDQDGSWPLTDALRETPRALVRTLSEEAWRSMAALTPDTDLFADLIVLHAVAPSWEQARPPRVPILRLGAPTSPEPRTIIASPVIAWDRTHPIMRHVSLDGVLVNVEPAARAVMPADATPLAWTQDGPVISAADRDGLRSITLAFPASGTTWTLTFGWPLFLDNAVAWLTRRDESQSGHVWTTAAPIATPWPLASPVAALLGPDGLVIRADLAPVGGLLRAAAPRSVGLHALIADAQAAPPQQAPIPVALLDPAESALATRDRLSVGASTIAATTSTRGPREVWHLFLAAALAILTIEWFLFAARSRV